MLREISHLEGFYVPSLYDVSYNSDGTIASFSPRYPDVPVRVRKRIISDMDSAYFPDKLIMPYIETVHDRIVPRYTAGVYVAAASARRE